MRAPLVIAAAVVLSLALPGCAEEFTPASTVDKLRVLGIRSEPAELRPGETSTLSALVLDPSRPGKRNTLVWFSCDPDPLNLGRSACSDLGELSDSASLVSTSSNGALELPPGMRLAGFGDTAVYTAPADLFAQLPAEDERRRTGSVAQLLLMAIAEEVSPAATREELDALLARVRSREVDSIILYLPGPGHRRGAAQPEPAHRGDRPQWHSRPHGRAPARAAGRGLTAVSGGDRRGRRREADRRLVLDRRGARG